MGGLFCGPRSSPNEEWTLAIFPIGPDPWNAVKGCCWTNGQKGFFDVNMNGWAGIDRSIHKSLDD